jgi:hypothetical protein
MRRLLGVVLLAGLGAACASHPLRAADATPAPTGDEELVVLALQYELDIAEAYPQPTDGEPVYVEVSRKPVSKAVLRSLRPPKGFRLRPAPTTRCLTGGCWSVSVATVERADRTCKRVRIELGELCGDCRARCPGCGVPIVMGSCHQETEWCLDGGRWQFQTRRLGCWDS